MVFIKYFQKTKNTIRKTKHTRLFCGLKSAPLLLVASFLLLGGLAIPLVRADSYQQQINTLNAQNSQAQGNLSSLGLQATSYQDQIAQIQTQINTLQAAIQANQARQADLQQQIVADQAKIAQEKQVLGDDIRTMYTSGQMSTIEELATSKSLSDFVDAEAYRSAVADSIQTTLKEVTSLQIQLQSQKVEVEQLLSTQTLQQNQLSSEQTQQNQLLAMNQQQQDQYNQKIAGNNAQISRLRAAQAAANASIGRAAHVVGASGGSGGDCDIGQGNGGYPMSWCNASQDSVTDANGFPNRECTSFADWYFTSVEGQTGFTVSGNAGWWWETSNYTAFTWSQGTVKVGALGIEPSSSLNAPVPSLHGGFYGHVMIVKALPGQTFGGQYVPDGYVLVASMNEDESGHFMYNLWPVSYLMFINPQ